MSIYVMGYIAEIKKKIANINIGVILGKYNCRDILSLL
jgi:hypothetical protein